MNTETPLGFIPLFERVLVLPDDVELVTETGIVLSVDARKRSNTGTVIALGHLITEHAKCPVKVGDKILYQRYSGLEVKWASTNYHLIMANDLLAIINNVQEKQFDVSIP